MENSRFGSMPLTAKILLVMIVFQGDVVATTTWKLALITNRRKPRCLKIGLNLWTERDANTLAVNGFTMLKDGKKPSLAAMLYKHSTKKAWRVLNDLIVCGYEIKDHPRAAFVCRWLSSPDSQNLSEKLPRTLLHQQTDGKESQRISRSPLQNVPRSGRSPQTPITWKTIPPKIVLNALSSLLRLTHLKSCPFGVTMPNRVTERTNSPNRIGNKCLMAGRWRLAN